MTDLELIDSAVHRSIPEWARSAFLAGTALSESVTRPGSGTLGDLTDASSYEYSRKGVRIYLPTDEERASATAWHLYWREHGYHTLDEELAAGAPPEPLRHEHGRWVEMTWVQVRAHLLEGISDHQLDIFEAVAA